MFKMLAFKHGYLIWHIMAIYFSYLVFLVATVAAFLYLLQDNNLKRKNVNVILSRLPGLDVLDKLNYRFIGLGFPLLTLAIIIGSLWSKDITGFYWSWNLRWVYSLVVWLIYALTLHVRLSAKLRGRKVALLSLAAFTVIILSLLVNC